MRAAGRGAAAVVAVLALAGCGGGVAAVPQVETADVRGDASCLDPDVLDALGLTLDPSLQGAAPEPTTRGLPPEEFVADSVVVCDRGETLRDSAGRWWAVSRTLLEGDIAPLTERLPRATSPACGPGVVPQVWLLDAMGAAVLLPRGATCDGAVADALADLQVVERTEHPVALAQDDATTP